MSKVIDDIDRLSAGGIPTNIAALSMIAVQLERIADALEKQSAGIIVADGKKVASL